MKDGVDDIERVADRIEAENARAIQAARAELASAGSSICLSCGCEIDAERRAAMPSARRCFECQQFLEQEKYQR